MPTVIVSGISQREARRQTVCLFALGNRDASLPWKFPKFVIPQLAQQVFSLRPASNRPTAAGPGLACTRPRPVTRLEERIGQNHSLFLGAEDTITTQMDNEQIATTNKTRGGRPTTGVSEATLNSTTVQTSPNQCAVKHISRPHICCMRRTCMQGAKIQQI